MVVPSTGYIFNSTCAVDDVSKDFPIEAPGDVGKCENVTLWFRQTVNLGAGMSKKEYELGFVKGSHGHKMVRAVLIFTQPVTVRAVSVAGDVSSAIQYM